MIKESYVMFLRDLLMWIEDHDGSARLETSF